MTKRGKIWILCVICLILMSIGILVNKSQAFSWNIRFGNVSATGVIDVGQNITIYATVMNDYSSAKTRDIGLVIHQGLVNYSALLIKNQLLPANSANNIFNWTVLINATGDYELLFYIGGIESYKVMHLIVGAYPSGLPSQIIINETFSVNTTNYITNNFTLFLSETEYNTLINNITNSIYNTVINNIIVNNTIIINFPDNEAQSALYFGMVGLTVMGMYGIMSTDKTHQSYEVTPTRKKDGKRRSNKHWYNLLPFVLDRRFQYGLAMVFGVIGWIIGSVLIYPTFNLVIQEQLAFGYDILVGSYIFGLLFGTFIALLILSIDAFPLFIVALATSMIICIIIEAWMLLIIVVIGIFLSILCLLYLWKKSFQ